MILTPGVEVEAARAADVSMTAVASIQLPVST